MPKPSVVFHPAAAAEYADALCWYAERALGLGGAFEKEVQRAIRLIVASPKRWPRYGRRHRRILIRRFPYFVVYLTKRSRIWIVAVSHARRRPGFWRNRRT